MSGGPATAALHPHPMTCEDQPMDWKRLPFAEICAVDFEYVSTPGSTPKPICLVAQEMRSKRTIRLWHDEFGSTPPYNVNEHSLFVAYYASAEMNCHLALGWQLPQRILDL